MDTAATGAVAGRRRHRRCRSIPAVASIKESFAGAKRMAEAIKANSGLELFTAPAADRSIGERSREQQMQNLKQALLERVRSATALVAAKASPHRLLALGAAAAAVIACSPPDPGPATGAADASAIFVGGPIGTGDAAKPNAEAVAVRGGRIVAVGKRTEVLKLMGPTTELVDLKGRTLWCDCAPGTGSIREGQLADLMILSDNPATVGPAQAGRIVVLETIEAGRTVYKR